MTTEIHLTEKSFSPKGRRNDSLLINKSGNSFKESSNSYREGE
jgi:hypothetical protein